jgi:hypothetical protein
MTTKRAKRAKKRCPMCHAVSWASEPECSCGYEFGQDVDKVLRLLSAQLTGAWVVLGCMLALDVVYIAGTIYLAHRGIIFYALFVVIPLMFGTGRAVRKISITRKSIRQLARRSLPKATLRTE